MALGIFPRKRTRQPQGAIRLNTPIKFDFAWVGSQPRGSLVGPPVQSSNTAPKATPGGIAISDGYSVVASSLIPSLYATSWTEVGSVFLDGTNAVTVLSVRDVGQPVRFVPGSGLISLVMWTIVDVDIFGTLPTGVVNYVVRRVGSTHTAWINGKLFGTASAGNTPGASSGILPAIGSQAGSGASAGGGPLVATTGVMMVARTGQTFGDAYCAQLSANPWQLFAPANREFYFDAGGAATPTGTFASTLDGVTLVASGTVTDVGAFATTLGGVTLAAAGSVGSVPSGTFASTLDGVTLAAAGTITNVGSFSTTLAGVTLAASGTVAPNVTGTFATTLGGVTMAASGFVGIPPVINGTIKRRRNRSHVFKSPNY